MFDIAFSELMLIGVIALLVIGPERLPKVARTLGALAGRMQRYVATVKSDIEREVQFEDLQKIQQEIKQGVEAAKSKLSEVETEFDAQVSDVENSIASVTTPKTDDAKPKKTRARQAKATKPVTEKSNTAKTSTAKPRVSKPRASKPRVSKPRTAKSEVETSSSDKPKTTKPRVRKTSTRKTSTAASKPKPTENEDKQSAQATLLDADK